MASPSDSDAPSRAPVRPAMRQPLPPPLTPHPSSQAVVEQTGPWLVAGQGLKSYSLGLVLRLILGVLFAIAFLLALTTGDGGQSAKIVGVVFAIMSLTTGFMMLAGLGRFAHQPIDSPGRSAARFAATVLAVTVAIEMLSLLLSAGVALAGSRDLEIAERFAAHSTTLWKWAAALWVAHLGATIQAMWKLGPVLEKQRPSPRRFILPVLILASGVAALLVWSFLPSLHGNIVGSLLAVCLTALLLLVSLAIYVAAIDHFSKLLRTAGPVNVPKSTVRAS